MNFFILWVEEDKWMWRQTRQALFLVLLGLPMLTEAHLEVELGHYLHPQQAAFKKWTSSC